MLVNLSHYLILVKQDVLSKLLPPVPFCPTPYPQTLMAILCELIFPPDRLHMVIVSLYYVPVLKIQNAELYPIPLLTLLV